MLIDYHRTLLGDLVRNDAFRRALEQAIGKDKTIVADIGSGTGFLGFMARALGAKKVYFYEYGDVLNLSKKIARANKIDGCKFFHAHSSQVEDAPPVDLIVSETLGNYALEEHIIATVEDAKRFLKPGGRIIPGRIEQFVCPVTASRFYDELTLWDDAAPGFDFSAAKEMSLNNIYVRTFAPGDLLDGGAAAPRWDEVDFSRPEKPNRKGQADWTFAAPATVYGFAVWWRCELVPGVGLGTGPLDPKTHWEQLYFPVLEPVAVKKGDGLDIIISSTSSHQEGTILRWQTAHHPAGGKPVLQRLDIAKGYLG